MKQSFRYLLAMVLLASLVLTPGLGGAALASAVQLKPGPGPAPGETCVVLQPGPSNGRDSYITQEKPDERRGGDAQLRVKSENNKLMRALLQFDLSSIPPSANISSATLSLYVTTASGGTVTINAHRVTNSWNEDQVTWKARDKKAGLLWSTQGGDYDPAVAAATSVDNAKNVWRSWDITGLAASWLSNPASNFGVILESSGGKTEKIFRSSDDSTAKQRPKLEVCYSAGVTVEPDNSGDGVAGQTKTYAHVVRVGNLTTVVNLSASSSRGWTTRILRDVNGNGLPDLGDTPITQTPSIGPNVDYPILVQVDVPVGVALGTQDTTTVTATAQANGATDRATDVTRVGQALSLQPNYSRYATAGSTVFYGHTLTNNTSVQQCVVLSATSSLGWTVLLWEDLNGNGVHEVSDPNEPPVPAQVCLVPGQTYRLVAEVKVPAGAVAGVVDQTVITATSNTEPGVSDSASDTTTVFVDVVPVVDGKYDAIYNASPFSKVVCYNDENGVLFGKLATYYQPTSNAVYMTLAIDKDFVDNTYGANAVNWPSGHTFGNLTGSDHAQFYGYDANDNLVLNFKLDYLTSKSGTPSGYDSLGVSGGDGGISVGSAANIQQWGTSLAYSLNNLGYCTGGNCAVLGTNLTVDSPATDGFYTPNPIYPDWIFDVIYEVKINTAAFGAAGFGSMDIPYIHASPSKVGTNTIYAEPGVCPGEIGDFVWFDANHNGIQDPGESGINGVQLKLYADNGDGIFNALQDVVVGTRTTTSGGKYLFQNLPPGDYFVDVVDSTVPAGYVITTHNDPTDVINLGEGQSYLQADFGYSQAYAELQIDKTQITPDPILIGQEVHYKIEITNVGTTIINFLPLQDWYDADKLDFLGATPATNDTVDDGVLNWSNLVASFGQTLNPGETFEVVVRFRAMAATKSLEAVGEPEAVDPKAVLASEPVVDGLLDSSYNYVGRVTASDNSSSGGLFTYAGSSLCYYAYVMDRRFNSNVYADNDSAYLALDGWGNHKFGDLLGSDKAVFDITYPGGSYTGLTLDYLNGTTGNWSSGQTGKDGSKVAGTPPIHDAMTSLHWNLENSNWNGAGFGGDPLKHSPPYDYNHTSGNYWEWNLIYEMAIPRSAMGGQCGTAVVASGHNSPNKNDAAKAVIGDLVWGDANRNAAQDSGELGLPGIQVNLFQGNTLVRTTHTEPGPTGYYLFSNLAGGSYRVDVVEASLPPNYSLTTNNEPLNVSVAAGGSFLTADFGYWLRGNGIIGDRVFYDLNGDGLPDNDPDPGLNGVTVRLYAGNTCTGTPQATRVTSGNGNYEFGQLLAGTYCVAVDTTTLPSGLAPTTGNAQFVVNLAEDQAFRDADFGYRAPCVDGVPNFTAISGALDQTGGQAPGVSDWVCTQIEQPRGAIGDFVWYDANGDGIQSVFEPGIPNVTLDLYRDSNGNNVLDAGDVKVASTVTDADGGYLFINLPPATYFVDVTDVNGQLAGLRHIVANQSKSDPTPAIPLAAGEVYKDADFGYVHDPAPGNALIGDTVWYDSNGDGVQQPGELGIPNIEVCATSLTDDAVRCSMTDSNGFYLIEVPEGAYSVAPSNPPAGYSATTPVPVEPVVVLEGDQYLRADFGYNNPALLGQIGNLVFRDNNQNGVFETGVDAALPGVSVDLIADLNSDGLWQTGEPVVATVTTVGTLDGSNGNYLFPGVPAGRYLVHVSDTNGVLIDFVKSPLGPTPGANNNNQRDPYPVNLPVDGSNLTADFGYYQLPGPSVGVIGNQVWIERDVNGLFDPLDGDFGQPGVTVELLQSNAVIRTTTTGASGDYAFTSLPAGIYQVRVSDAFGVLTGWDVTTLGPNPGQDHNNQAQPYTVNLPQAGFNLTADFGYKAGPNTGIEKSQIGNLLWHDLNGDGVFQVGETPIGSVSIELWYDNNSNCVYDAGDFRVMTQNTSPSFLAPGGNYLYDAILPAGNYLVRVTDAGNALAGYTKSTGPQPGVNNNSQATPYCIQNFNPTGLGDVNLTADFGYFRPVTLGDFAWIDTNSNGVYDPGSELPLNGVVIRVTNSAGQVVATAITGPAGGFPPGTYLVSNLPPGTYTATVVDAPAGYVLTGPASQTRTLQSGQTDLTLDFPFINTTSVALASLSTTSGTRKVTLQWQTVAEQGNQGFFVERSITAGGPYKRLTASVVPSQGAGGSTYTWVDNSVEPGRVYWYRLVTAPDGVVFGPVSGRALGGKLFLPLVVTKR